jgi:hypothetical protein
VGQDVNRYLEWAFIEAANAFCLHHKRFPQRRVYRLYERVARRKGYQEAREAAARHLARATFWMLKKRELKKVSSTEE